MFKKCRLFQCFRIFSSLTIISQFALSFFTFWFLSSRAKYFDQQFFAKGNLQSALKLISFCLQDLLKDLKYELGGNFETIVIALMMPSADYDATSLRKAIKVCFVSLLIRR